ncbi:SRPBCC domain-containing protein [Novosphingobium sp. G106]|uniref:SRPBCC family protein n=1 Tax=Novosphingobium sp. G106 TaxID=2849500 RepID=UPI001C2D06D9|nr:SRPBCC domain-containing protein [Novosphingobium sp. G106]MBV1690120.1 SRPBCC domain-containing protein [Novosphingobium sp. G106]
MVDILHAVSVRAPAGAVYDALTSREGLAGWWTEETTTSLTDAGEKLHFGFGGRGFFDMDVVERHPAERVAWRVTDGPEEWIGTSIEWDLASEGGFTDVTFRHCDWREPVPFMHHCSTKWATFLLSLKSLVETGAGAPFPDDVQVGRVS